MMTLQKLRGSSGALAAEYYKSENYYSQQGETLTIHGDGCGELGLTAGARLDLEQFTRLLDGNHPGTGERLTRSKSTRGYDMTFSADKSVSLFATTHGHAEARAAHEAAVSATMEQLQYVVGRGRRGPLSDPEAGRIVWAQVTDGLSRSNDAHLHTHCVIANAVILSDGKVVTLDSLGLMKADLIKQGGQLYRTYLKAELERRGYKTEITKDGGVCLPYISKAEQKTHSRRRADILEAKDRKNRREGEDITLTAAELPQMDRAKVRIGDTVATTTDEREQTGTGERTGEVIALDRDGHTLTLNLDDGRQIVVADNIQQVTRAKITGFFNKKTKAGTVAMCHVELSDGRTATVKHGLDQIEIWADTRAGKAKGPADLEAIHAEQLERSAALDECDQYKPGRLHDQGRAQWIATATRSVEARQEREGKRGGSDEITLWSNALERVTDKDAIASDQALVTQYLAERMRSNLPPVTLDEAARLLAEQVKQDNLIIDRTGKRFSSYEFAAIERHAIELAGETGNPALTLTPDAVRALIKQIEHDNPERSSLSAEQAAAVVAVIAHDGRAAVLQGLAGSGKTYAMSMMQEISKRQGWDIRGTSVSGKATVLLSKDSGIGSKTVASYLHATDTRKRAPRLLIVDEASMIGSRDAEKLLIKASEHGDKIIFVGDDQQTKSVCAGHIYGRLLEQATAAGNVATMSENYRQRSAMLRDVVAKFRGGEERAALHLLDEHNSVKEISEQMERYAAIAAEYKRGECLVLTGTRASREVLNLIIRDEEIKRGNVEAGQTIVTNYRDDDGCQQTKMMQLATGDRIMFTENDRRLMMVSNGDTGTVTHADTQIVKIRTDDGRNVVCPLIDYAWLSYGYAVTTHAAQGATVNKCIVNAETDFLENSMLYVQLTRARNNVSVYTDDRDDLLTAAETKREDLDTIDIAPGLTAADARAKAARIAANVAAAIAAAPQLTAPEVPTATPPENPNEASARRIAALVKTRKQPAAPPYVDHITPTPTPQIPDEVMQEMQKLFGGTIEEIRDAVPLPPIDRALIDSRTRSLIEPAEMDSRINRLTQHLQTLPPGYAAQAVAELHRGDGPHMMLGSTWTPEQTAERLQQQHNRREHRKTHGPTRSHSSH